MPCIAHEILFLTLSRCFAKTRQFEFLILVQGSYLVFQTSHTKLLVFAPFGLLFLTSFHSSLLLLKLLLGSHSMGLHLGQFRLFLLLFLQGLVRRRGLCRGRVALLALLTLLCSGITLLILKGDATTRLGSIRRPLSTGSRLARVRSVSRHCNTLQHLRIRIGAIHELQEVMR